MDTVFLAFANSDTNRLETLSIEDEKVNSVLSNYHSKGAINLVREQYATTDKLIEIFLKFQDKLSVFLFSGHAGRDCLMLEDQNANADGIAELLKRCPNIKLVVLNGCSTKAQVQQLLNNGIPIVIATSAPVGDKSATKFSINFFTALAEKSKTIGQAFEDGIAAAKVITNIQVERDINFGKNSPSDNSQQNEPLWGIFYNKENESLLDRTLGYFDEVEDIPAIYNQYLTKKVIESIRTQRNAAGRFWEKIKSIPEWETQDRICAKAKEIIAYSFVGVIGIQLSKLMAIGKEENSDLKKRKYIKKCIFIAEKSLDLINFALLSKLWDQQKKENINFSDQQTQKLEKYFNAAFEFSVLEKFKLLQQLYPVFASNKLEFPISELKNLEEMMTDHSELHQSCQVFNSLNQSVDKGTYNQNECVESERKLAVFLKHFSFLVNYRMASIKRIGYNQIRNAEPHFLHRFTALGIDSKANVDAEQVIYTPETVHTDSVLLYKGDNYQENINLFPFVIDYNALTFEHGAKICFFRSINLNDESLEYLFLEDNSVVNIEHKGIIDEDIDFNELMMSNEKRIILNLDNVVSAFQQARSSFLIHEINLDDI